MLFDIQRTEIPVLQEFNNGLLFGRTLLLFWPNLKFVALPFPEITAIGVLGGLRTPNLGEGEAIGGWDDTVRKSKG